MKAVIRDADALSSIRPLELASYLRTHGWRRTENDPRSSVWVGGPRDEYEVLIPLDTRLRDFALRMSTTMRALAEAESRSELEIFHEIQTASSDLIRVRCVDRDFRNGSIPLQAGVALMERSRDLFLAAACSAHQQRSVFHSRKPAPAVEYLKRVRLGQTENGSFVVTIHAPVPPLLGEHDNSATSVLFDGSEPYERRVTAMLMSAAFSANEAAQEAAASGTLDPFESAVGRGVSANLCDALVSLFDDTHCDSLEVSVNWAPVRPVSTTIRNATPRIVTFSRDVRPLLEEAVRTFKRKHPEVDTELTGYVVKLSRDDLDPLAREATIVGKTSAGIRHVRVPNLSPSDHEVAVEAYRSELAVRIAGDLRKEAGKWVLANARDIATLAPEEH